MEQVNLPSTPHQRGAALEDLLEWQHNLYQSQRRAFLYRNGTQGKIRGGKAILVRSRPDFSGMLTCMGGRYVSFDAKLTASAHYYHPTERLHQLKDLWEVHQAGGISFLLISLNLERTFLIWPDYSWENAQKFSIRLDQMTSWEGCEVRTSGFNQLPDWLTTVEREEGRK